MDRNVDENRDPATPRPHLWLRVTLGLFACGCGGTVQDPAGGRTDAAVSNGKDGGTTGPGVAASDPCVQAGYFFDGSSDCDEVRCPQLDCECEAPAASTSTARSSEPITITLSACVPGRGCLSRADCARVCSPLARLAREACEARIAAAGALACAADADCVAGDCREESVGGLCVDGLGCAEDGHCSSGSRCLFDPEQLDADTGAANALGACSTGAGGARCFEDDDCAFQRCVSGTCSNGLVGESCSFNSHCASDHCRSVESSSGERSGNCVSGAPGGACYDDGDCDAALHCTGGLCFSGTQGQLCDSDEQCDSAVCVSGRCHAGQPGARCEEDSDCKQGLCSGYLCTSGGPLAPCGDASDCAAGLACARRYCSDGTLGAPCSSAEDCKVRACVGGTCSAGESGDECDADADCESGRCANPPGVEPGECTSGAAGSFCLYASHCLSGTCGPGSVCD